MPPVVSRARPRTPSLSSYPMLAKRVPRINLKTAISPLRSASIEVIFVAQAS